MYGSIWDRVEGLFHFPESAIGSGNIRKRAIARARIFVSAYLYKLVTGCSWNSVPAVKKGLVSAGGINQRLTNLRKHNIFAK